MRISAPPQFFSVVFGTGYRARFRFFRVSDSREYGLTFAEQWEVDNFSVNAFRHVSRSLTDRLFMAASSTFFNSVRPSLPANRSPCRCYDRRFGGKRRGRRDRLLCAHLSVPLVTAVNFKEVYERGRT
jgi:hypothetical protein